LLVEEPAAEAAAATRVTAGVAAALLVEEPAAEPATAAAAPADPAAAGGQAAELADVAVAVLGVVAVGDGGGHERPAGVDVDGFDDAGDRMGEQVRPRGSAALTGQERRREGARDRQSSPIPETHGHSLYIVRCFPPGVSGIES